MSLSELNDTLSTNILVGLIIITAYFLEVTSDLGLTCTRPLSQSPPPI